MTAPLLTGHRKIAPYGMKGGEVGQLGINQLKRANGVLEDLGTIAEVKLEKEDAIIIQTPGGGYGASKQ
jgi:5-oxoprolinase (ATP-hydrolysing)